MGTPDPSLMIKAVLACLKHLREASLEVSFYGCPCKNFGYELESL